MEHETLIDRLKSKGPVTVGVLATGAGLAYGLKTMGSGGTGAQQNRGMSVRVGLQGTALALIVGYSIYMKHQRDHYEALLKDHQQSGHLSRSTPSEE